MMDLDEMVNGAPAPTVETADEQQQVEQPVVEQTAEGAPTAPAEHQVPLAALEAERATRNDWKAKAVAFETELKMLREQHLREQHLREQQPAPAQQTPLDPLQSMQQQIVNERFNTSEMLVRQAHDDADEKVNLFMEAARANPALAAALQQQRHPWQFAYLEGKRMLMQKEFGDDPQAYEAKVRAKVIAEMQQSNPVAAPALNLPASLNGARSVASRAAPGFTGPTPLEAIVNFRR